MIKDTTLVCTIGDSIKIFHSTEEAKDMYENKKVDHEVVVLDFTDDLKKLMRLYKRIFDYSSK